MYCRRSIRLGRGTNTLIFTPFFGPWNALDLTVVLLLTAGMWTLQAVNARRRTHPPAPISARLLGKNFLVFGIPLTLLAIDWLATGRSAAALGLAIPVPPRGAAGLALAGVLVAGLVLVSKWPHQSPEQVNEGLARLRDRGLAPQTRDELAAAALLALLIGCGTEILFRGFLVFAFTPVVGLWGAVVVAALAYGLGHGDASWKETLGSLVSAFVFTVAFAATGSLYWLMVVHSFVGLFTAWIGYRATSAAHAPDTFAP